MDGNYDSSVNGMSDSMILGLQNVVLQLEVGLNRRIESNLDDEELYFFNGS